MEKKITSRDIRAEERKQELLLAAKELFSEKGYHATSMRSINQKVGMAEGLTYHYFPNGKMEILQTIIKKGLQEQQNKISEIIFNYQDDLTIKESLILLTKKACEILIEDKQLLQILIKEKNLMKNEDSQFLSNISKRIKKMVSGFLSTRADKGQIKQLNFDLAALQFISNISLIFIQEVMDVKFIEDDLESFVENMVDFTLESWSDSESL